MDAQYNNLCGTPAGRLELSLVQSQDSRGLLLRPVILRGTGLRFLANQIGWEGVFFADAEMEFEKIGMGVCVCGWICFNIADLRSSLTACGNLSLTIFS